MSVTVLGITLNMLMNKENCKIYIESETTVRIPVSLKTGRRKSIIL